MIHTPTKRLLRVCSLVLTTLFLSAPALLAQAEEKASADKNALQKWVLDGGWPMILIGLTIVALLALSVFNFINLTKPKFCPDDLKAALLDHMLNCRVRSAIELSASHPSYLGRMLAYSLPNIDATKPEDLGRDAVEDAIADFTIKPDDFGLTIQSLDSIRVDSAEQSLELIRQALGGNPGPAYDMVMLNAGATLYAADLAPSLAEGIIAARAILDSSAALGKLEEMAAYTQRFEES